MVQNDAKQERRSSFSGYKIFILPALVIILALIFRDPISQHVFDPGRDISAKVSLTELVFTSVKEAAEQRGGEGPAPGFEKRAGDSAREAELQRTKLAGKSILWVDDQPRNNTLLQNGFTAVGIRVFQAPTNEDARSLMDQIKFDLVITDVGRSGNRDAENGPTKGLELIPDVNSAGIPVIIYSASWSGSHEGQERQERALLITNDPTRVYATAISTLSR